MLLLVKDLFIEVETERGCFPAVEGVSFSVASQEVVALVGESGCGKSLTAHSILGLLPKKARVSHGQAMFLGENLLSLSPERLYKVRGGEVGMVFQDSLTALNPVLPVGKQIAEVLEVHEPSLPSGQAVVRVVEMLRKVGIPDPQTRYHQYPHELSGGLRQRVMLAMALVCRPKLLIADEPTTALDVTIQAQILKLLKSLQQEFGLSVLLITHDLGIVSEFSDRLLVMYAGKIVEEGNSREVLRKPLHPYTEGLIRSIPHKRQSIDERLQGIVGVLPPLGMRGKGCYFADRCERAIEKCMNAEPLLEERQRRHSRCFETRWESLK